MVWLLIIFCLAVALSPLLWMKSSPHQQQVMACRNKARSLGINVSVCRQPDAVDSEKRLDAILYAISWSKDILCQPWILHRRNNRGWQSCFDRWCWVAAEADSTWSEIIGSIIQTLPDGVTAIVVNKEGVGFVWDERDGADCVEDLHHFLIKLRKKGEEICI